MNQDFLELLRALSAYRIDILTEISGVAFAEVWPTRVRAPFGPGLDVDYIGREEFIRNKRATGRTKDLGDIEGL